MNGIKKNIQEKDENGNIIEVEVTEYPDIPVIVVNGGDNEEEFVNNDSSVSAVQAS